MLFKSLKETDYSDPHILRETEQLFKIFAEKSENIDQRSKALMCLAELYAFGFKDERLMEEMLWKLPSFHYARETVVTNIFLNTKKRSDVCQYHILCLANAFAYFAREYIAFMMPNDASR